MPGPAHLLDGNVVVALIDEAHVHHAAARQWFSGLAGAFATCPITQGTLSRLVMRLALPDAMEACLSLSTRDWLLYTPMLGLPSNLENRRSWRLLSEKSFAIRPNPGN